MALSQLVEKLKFGEKYILANIVVMPLAKQKADNDELNEYKLPARNKFLTFDIWESFVYRKLYDLFRKKLSTHDKEPQFQLNTEYHMICNDRPYLQMKYEFRDKHYRNNLNILFKEKFANLYDICIYVEISDHGKAIFDKVENLDRTIQCLSKEIEHIKRENTNVTSEPDKPKLSNPNRVVTSEVEEYHPEPVRKSARNTDEEYVPVTRNGTSPGIKRTYKPSKITDGGQPVHSTEPDPYTPPGTTDTPIKISYTPTTPSPQNKLDVRKIPIVKPPVVEKSLFGSDDDEEYDPTKSKVSAEPLQAAKNDSGKDMFSDNDQPNSPNEDMATQSSTPPTYVTGKREVLPRSSKQNLRGTMIESPEEKEKRKAKALKKSGPSAKQEEESINALLQLKKVIRKKAAQRKEASLKKQGKLEKISEVATEMKRLSKVEVLDCVSLSKQEILDTFQKYSHELHDIFTRYKDQTERQWKSSPELCYFTDIGNILDDEQKFVMMQHLEDEFVSEKQRGKYTEFFTSTLLMEWGLRIFMERHNFTSRELALERIKQQEKSYIASLSDEFMVKYH
ncbi:uncharacterized protein LOC126557617 [Anopheles maculipalpis]|uniref:uncharacterized protein LOC126557617 n=1 Tax=Anopheles maculipalpis TaxID=1496333 RepID=UPI0021592977|nr:uncharacterized protein LOC126557617 [Anopheles maculipalpis]